MAEKLHEHEISFSFRRKATMGGVKRLKGAWRLGVLKQEYNRLKKIQDQQQQ